MELIDVQRWAQDAMDKAVGQQVVARAAQIQELLELASKLVSYGEFEQAAAWARQAERELNGLNEVAEMWRAGR